MFKSPTNKNSPGIGSLTIAVLLIANAAASIHIWEPKSLKAMYAGHEIPYSIMNFGLIPYGHSIYGTVFKASPYDGCTELSPLKWDKNYGTLIVMVERGGCNFSEKVFNAQKIGAGLVLIADNNNEDVHKIFPVERTKEMLDKVHIPSVLISKTDADNFQSAIETAVVNSRHHKDQGQVELAFHFDLVKVNKQSSVRIILQVDDYRSYDLIHDFYTLYPNFKNSVHLKIHFKLFFNSGMYFADDDCIKSGNDTFCVSKSFGNTQTNLRLPHETLKQLCMKNYDVNLFLNYSKNVRNSCFEDNRQIVKDFAECTGRVFEGTVKSDVRKKLVKCMTPDETENLAALKTNHDEIKYFMINYSPLVFVNGHYYKGNFDDVNHLFETICNSFETPPKSCHSLQTFETVSDLNSVSLMKFIFISIGVCVSMIVVAIALFYIVYKKKIRKTFNFKLNDQINEALAKYYNENDEEPGKSQPNEESHEDPAHEPEKTDDYEKAD
jgi:hypothetical protein